MGDQMWWVVAAVVAAAFVQGYASFGFGIVAMALMAFLPIDIERGSTVTTLAGVVMLITLLAISCRDHPVRWRFVPWILLGAVVGSPLGYAFIVYQGDAPLFGTALGVVLLGFAFQGLWRAGSEVLRAWPRWLELPVGLANGFLGGAFVTGGPPVVLYLTSRVHDPREMKATIQLIFLGGMLIRLAVIGGGPIGLDAEVLGTAGIAIPVVLLAIVVGHRLSQRAGVAAFKRVIFVLIGIAGVGLLLRHGGALVGAWGGAATAAVGPVGGGG